MYNNKNKFNVILFILEDLIAIAFIFILFSSLFSFHTTASRRPVSLGAFVRFLRSTSSGVSSQAQARRGRTGKAISRKWRARYTGRRAVQFRISNWYSRTAESPALWSDESAVCRWENVPTCVSRASWSLRESLDNVTSESRC